MKKQLDADFPDLLKFKLQKLSELHTADQLVLKVDVFDQDSLSDDIIGRALVSLADLVRVVPAGVNTPLLLAPREHTFTAQLTSKDGTRSEGFGTVSFRATLIPQL